MPAELGIIGVILAIVLVAAVGFAPLTSEIVGSDLRVHTRLKTFHYNMQDVAKSEAIRQGALSMFNTFRLCAVGRPLKPFGWVWNRQYGLILAMVNDDTKMVLLRIGRRNLLVSPANYSKLS